jgi:prephenate dehydrogenase
MRVAFLGLGLIGGSIARALRSTPEGRAYSLILTAWTPGGSGPQSARDAGVITLAAASPAEAFAGAVVVVLAAPPDDCLALLRELAGPLRPALGPDAVITDVASTKASIVALADVLRQVRWAPDGRSRDERLQAADAGLFRNRPWVVVPGAVADAAAVMRVEAFADACGARTVRMDAAEHDAAVAAISHLPLVLSAALVEAVTGGHDGPRSDWPAAAVLAATGWESMTRLARGDVEMGTGIATTNAPAIAARLRDLRAVLDAWLEILEAPAGPDETAIRDHLASARARLEDRLVGDTDEGAVVRARASSRARAGSVCVAREWTRRWPPSRARAGSWRDRSPRRTRATSR